jgi:hypothetical protein
MLPHNRKDLVISEFKVVYYLLVTFFFLFFGMVYEFGQIYPTGSVRIGSRVFVKAWLLSFRLPMLLDITCNKYSGQGARPYVIARTCTRSNCIIDEFVLDRLL